VSGTTRKKGRRPTQAERQERELYAVQLLTRHAGLRLYELQTRLTQRFGVSRRVAANILARARETLRAEMDDRLRDLASSLPEKIHATLSAAMEKGDLRSAVRVLQLVADLARPNEDEPAAPATGIEFRIVDPDGEHSEHNGVSAGGYASCCPDRGGGRLKDAADHNPP